MISVSLAQYSENQHGFFVKAFFINPKRNKNRWKVSAASIKKGMETSLDKTRFYGKTAPLIKRPDYAQADKLGHPNPYTDDMVRDQEPSRVGDIIFVGVENMRGWVIINVTDEPTKEGFRTGKYRFFSPSIAPQNNNSFEDTKWSVNHLAIVDDPAYGYGEAQVTGSCTGAEAQCVRSLQASLEPAYNTPNENSKLKSRRDILLVSKKKTPLLKHR